jgi:hypothetical protein
VHQRSMTLGQEESWAFGEDIDSKEDNYLFRVVGQKLFCTNTCHWKLAIVISPISILYYVCVDNWVYMCLILFFASSVLMLGD